MATKNIIDRELTDSELRRAVESLWPDRKEQHLTEEEIAYIAEIYVSCPDEMASPHVQHLTSHLWHCPKCLEDLSFLTGMLKQEAHETEREPVACPEIALSFLEPKEPIKLPLGEQGLFISSLEVIQRALEEGERILHVTQRWSQRGMRALRSRVAELLERKLKEAQAKQGELAQAIDRTQLRERTLEGKMDLALRWAQGYLSSRGRDNILLALAQQALELFLYLFRPLQRAFFELQLEIVRARRDRLEKELQDTIRLQGNIERRLQYLRMEEALREPRSSSTLA